MKYNKIIYDKNIRNADDDDDDKIVGSLKMFNDTKIINDVDAYLDEPIRQVHYYRDLLQYMRRMEEGDKLTIWITSPGGYMDSATAINQAMRTTKGQTTVICDAYNASAATFIALAAPQLIVQEGSTWMLHSASFGASGKSDNVYSKVKFFNEEIYKELKQIYSGFLTDEEFDQMIDGKDFYMNYDEIIRRLEIRSSLQDQADKLTKD